MKESTCHPDRPHYSKNLCYLCYMANYRRTHPEYVAYMLEYARKYRKVNKDRISAYDRKRAGERGPNRKVIANPNPVWKQDGHISQKRWGLRNPDKRKVHVIANAAVKNGTLIKLSCWCGNPKTEAHHPDYSKPLEVQWLCRKHHKREHAKLRQNIPCPVEP